MSKILDIDDKHFVISTVTTDEVLSAVQTLIDAKKDGVIDLGPIQLTFKGELTVVQKARGKDLADQLEGVEWG